MLKKSLPLALIALAGAVFAGEGWLTNVDKALEQAKKENKSVLVEFTGSDWCPPCKALKSNIFDSEEFKKYAEDKLVLVELDFPRTKEIAPEQKEYNSKIAKEYGIRGYPTVFILDSEGKPVWSRVGGGEKEEYLKVLADGVKNQNVLKDALAAAAKAQGLEKAKLLDKAVKAMTGDMTKTVYASVIEEIKALDKEDTLGYLKAEKEAEAQKKAQDAKNAKIREMSQNIQALISAGKYDEAEKAIQKAVEENAGNPAVRPMLIGQKVNLFLVQEDIDGALAYLEGLKGGDDSKFAEMYIKHLTKNKDKILEQTKQMKADKKDKKTDAQ